jgi:uncharacterized membrane protein YqgA involved in biofilm formation
VIIGGGTLINIIAILFGTFLGLFVGKKFRSELRDLLTGAMGFVVLIAAADSLRTFWDQDFQDSFDRGVAILVILFSLAFGALLGHWSGIERRLENLGTRLRDRFSNDENPRFVEGFLAASILFGVGPMAVLGGISDGMGEGIDLLILKSTLDFFMSIMFAATYGWGVGLAAFPVGIYQFIWTGIGFGLGEVLSTLQIQALTITGGILLIGIALGSMGIKRMAVGNLLPAIFIAPLLAGVFSR